MNPQSTPQVNPKLAQYLEELNTLNTKYQYQLVAKIRVTDQGIVPYITPIDIVPPKTEPKKVIKKEKK